MISETTKLGGIETDIYDNVPASTVLLGSPVRFIRSGTVGWVVEKYADKKRPGSIVVYRVLFPDGIFWISQYWLKKK
jgi:hypothetical protein